MQIGVIGTGNIGGMLARAFAAEADHEVRIYNRTAHKAETIVQDQPRIRLASDIQKAARHCDVVFLCTKAEDGKHIIGELSAVLSEAQVLATTISTVPISYWESATAARVAKVIPSITQNTRSGVVLVSYGSRFDDAQSDAFEHLISSVAVPFVIDEFQMRVCSDLTSCGPGFLAYLLYVWAKAAAATGALSHAEAEHLLCRMLCGTADLLNSGLTLQDILDKVTVPGGVTESGLSAIQPLSEQLFTALHRATGSHQTHGESAQKMISFVE